MKLYNSRNGIILVVLIFISWVFIAGKSCPCDNIQNNCLRIEFYGVQLNHLFFFLIMGLLFPSYFYTWLFIGSLWEVFEYFLELYPSFVTKFLGGCLSYPPKNFNKHNNELYNFYVYRNIDKYVNPIDKFFNIQNSKIHGWHSSVAEILLNIISFYIGSFINKIIFNI